MIAKYSPGLKGNIRLGGEKKFKKQTNSGNDREVKTVIYWGGV